MNIVPTKDIYGPTTLRIMGSAFDVAWREIADKVGSDPYAIQAARLNLAIAVLAATNEDSRDVEALTADALSGLGVERSQGHGAHR